MPTFLNTTFASFFKRILQFGHSGNTGTPTSTTNIQAGDGVATSISLSDDVLSVQPVTDNTTGTFLVKNQGGSNILAVDTNTSAGGSRVLVGASQIAANTQYAYFGVDAQESGAFTTNTHYMIPFASNSISAVAGHTIGTGDEPDLSKTITSTAYGVVGGMWYIPDNITVDAVYWWSGANVSGGDVTRVHLVSYTVDTSNGTTGGDLSGGVIVADAGADITNAGYEQAYYQSLTIQSADIDAGKAVYFIFRADGTNNYAINATVKYHIR